MKKAMTIVLVVLMLVAMLAACSAKNPTTPTVETTVPPTTMAPTEPSTPVETIVPPTTESATDSATEPAPETQPTEGQDKVQPTDPKFEPKLALSSAKLTMKVGQSTTLSVSYAGGNRTLTWASSNTKVATVKDGKVTAKAPGKATITVTDGILKAKCEVTVYGEETKPTEPSKPTEYTLKVVPPTMSLTVGKTGNISYEYTGTGTLKWSSKPDSVATVSNGKVTAKAPGTAVITLTDGKKTSQCVVTVSEPKPTEPKPTLSLNKREMSLQVGESATLKASYTGTGKLYWSSDNSNIVSVNNSGKITAVSAGTTAISVTDGNLTAQCMVTVTNKPGTVAKLSLDKTSISLEVGATSTLKATYTGTGTLSWKSSNTAVASVSNGKVTAKSAGTATITVTDGKLEAKCTVTVTAPATEPTQPSVGELTIKTSAGTTIYVGESLQIEYTYTGDKSALTWKSNDTSVLTVNNSGKVTGVGVGETRVAVYHGETMVGRIRLVVEEKVVETEPPAKPKAESIEATSFTGPYFDGTAGVVGNYMTFKAFAETAGDNQAVTATSSNSGVVSVERTKVGSSNRCTFKVKFKGAGTATITITSEDGNASKSYTITVKGSYSSAKSGSLTPEEFVSCVNGIMKENGAKISTSMGYLVETLSADKLTGSNARSFAEDYVRDFWPNGIRSMGMSYQGVNEDGNHVFYIHR